MNTDTPTLPTRSAHWGFEEHQYFGHAVFGELLGNESLLGLTALGILGRRLSAAECSVLEDAAVALSMADPRIWPLKLSRVVAAYGSTLPAVAAGLVTLTGAQIGPWPTTQAAHMLQHFHSQFGDQAEDAAAKRDHVSTYLSVHSFLWGFGTPFRRKDERLVAFERRLQLTGLDRKPHYRTFAAVRRAAKELKGVEANIGSGLAAVCLDLGFSADQIAPLTAALIQHMFFSTALEAAQQAPALLRKLPDEHVTYVGIASRQSPRAQAGAAELQQR